MSAGVSIQGMGQRVLPAGSGRNLEELIFEAAHEALVQSALERSDIDGIVIAASDQTDGRAISSMLTSAPAGAYLNPEINIASSPGHAFVVACLSIVSGLRRRVLLSSWGSASESASEGGIEAAERLSTDPYFERHALSRLAACAIQAAGQRARPRGDEGARAVVAKNEENARGSLGSLSTQGAGLVAYPLLLDEVAPSRDGAFSLVLSAEPTHERPVWVNGLGWRCDSAMIAERDLITLPHLRAAGRDAAARAGLSTPAGVDVFELHDYTADAELLACEALGLCEDGDAPGLAVGGAFGRAGIHPVNPSGGSLAGEAPFGGPLGKILAACRNLRSAAGPGQAAVPGLALVQIAGGLAGQFQTVVVLGPEPRS